MGSYGTWAALVRLEQEVTKEKGSGDLNQATLADVVSQYQTASTEIKYQNDGKIDSVTTETPIYLAKCAALATTTLAFKPQLWFLPLIFLLEKAALVAIVVCAKIGSIE